MSHWQAIQLQLHHFKKIEKITNSKKEHLSVQMHRTAE